MSEQVIDRDTFEMLKSMTDLTFLQELIEVFLVDTPNQLAEMRASLEEGDRVRLQRAAHSLKSNSASFGAMRLNRLSREVELMAKEGRLAGTGAKIDEVDAEFQRVAPALAELKNG